jgi:CheY-like chemotaxis protein
MGGGLGIISRPGVGTTVWIELPASAAPVALRTPPADPAPRAIRKPPQTAMTVLYVEDNPSNVKLVEKILALREEVNLIVATDGASGVRLAREHRPTVVLLDLHLSDTPGASVLRQLQEHPATADIPVVIVSADASPNQVKRLRAAGAAGYLIKPFDVNQLLDAIDLHHPPVMAPAAPRISDTGFSTRGWSHLCTRSRRTRT